MVAPLIWAGLSIGRFAGSLLAGTASGIVFGSARLGGQAYRAVRSHQLTGRVLAQSARVLNKPSVAAGAKLTYSLTAGEVLTAIAFWQAIATATTRTAAIMLRRGSTNRALAARVFKRYLSKGKVDRSHFTNVLPGNGNVLGYTATGLLSTASTAFYAGFAYETLLATGAIPTSDEGDENVSDLRGVSEEDSVAFASLLIDPGALEHLWVKVKEIRPDYFSDEEYDILVNMVENIGSFGPAYSMINLSLNIARQATKDHPDGVDSELLGDDKLTNLSEIGATALIQSGNVEAEAYIPDVVLSTNEKEEGLEAAEILFVSIIAYLVSPPMAKQTSLNLSTKIIEFLVGAPLVLSTYLETRNEGGDEGNGYVSVNESDAVAVLVPFMPRLEASALVRAIKKIIGD